MTADALRGLDARLVAATGPDRELDADIVLALAPGAMIAEGYPTLSDDNAVFHADALGIPDKSEVPNYTASIDAALGLCQHLFPGEAWEVSGDPSGTGARVTFWPDGLSGKTEITRTAATGGYPALALCLATIRALLAKEASHD